MTRIAIVSTNAIGDTYLSAAAIEPLRRRFGECRIHVITLPAAEWIMPYIDADAVSYLSSRSTAGLLRLLGSLRGEAFDYVFSFFPGRVNSLIFRGLRGAHKAGFTNLRALPRWHDVSATLSGRGLTDGTGRWDPSMHFLERISIALAGCGIAGARPEKFHFRNLPEPGETRTADVVLHPRSRDPEKSLSTEGLRLVVSHLAARSRRILLIGRAGEVALPEDADPDRCGCRVDLPLPELVSLMSSCALFIGVDSFPLHVADVYCADFIGLFAPTRPAAVLQRADKGIRLPYASLEAAPPREIAERIDRCLDGKREGSA